MDITKLELEIRERSFAERIDLTFLIIRQYFSSIVFWSAVGMVPMAVLNFLFVFLFTDDYWQFGVWIGSWIAIGQLMLIQGAFACIPLMIFLSRRIFGVKATWKEVIAASRQRFGAMLVVHFITRGGAIFLGILMMAYINQNIELMSFFFFVHLMVYGLFYSCRPFIDHVLYLERLPVLKKKKRTEEDEITASYRSKRIMYDAGLSFAMVLVWFAAIYFTYCFYCLCLYGYFLFTANTVTQLWFGWVFLPLGFWGSQVICAVYLFVTYIDCRIRNEGWEIEIRMKMEATKLFPPATEYVSSGNVNQNSTAKGASIA